MGRDWRTWVDASAQKGPEPKWFYKLSGLAGVTVRLLGRPIVKLPRAICEEPRRLYHLPLALLVVVAGQILYFSGYLLPDRFTKEGPRHLGEKPVST